MHLHTRNVNTAFKTMIEEILAGQKGYAGAPPVVSRPSRNGNVLMIDEPVTVTYSRPRERVLFNSARDANPFFHLYESLWMLAGRNDVASLAYYTSKMAQFSDDGKTFNGSYGYRWRQAKYEIDDHGMYDTGSSTDRVDQLNILVNHLKADPNSRRAVLQMWNVEDDLLNIGPSNVCRRNHRDKEEGDKCLNQGHDLLPYSKDVCCNLNVMFSIREEALTVDRFLAAEHVKTEGSVATMKPPPANRYLDMTVTNRSNDLVWGCLGANYVHFTMLQEYMAAKIGVEVGRYNHFSNNLHVYENNWKPDEWLSVPYFSYEDPNLTNSGLGREEIVKLWGVNSMKWQVPLVKDPAVFDKELPEFVERHNGQEMSEKGERHWNEPFLEDVAEPMLTLFHWHKNKDTKLALENTDLIKADDWRIVAHQWLKRRVK